jgi:hypothetical protein
MLPLLPMPMMTNPNQIKEEEGAKGRSNSQSFSYYHHANPLPYLLLITSGTVLLLVIGLVISIRPLSPNALGTHSLVSMSTQQEQETGTATTVSSAAAESRQI